MNINVARASFRVNYNYMHSYFTCSSIISSWTALSPKRTVFIIWMGKSWHTCLTNLIWRHVLSHCLCFRANISFKDMQIEISNCQYFGLWLMCLLNSQCIEMRIPLEQKLCNNRFVDLEVCLWYQNVLHSGVSPLHSLSEYCWMYFSEL